MNIKILTAALPAFLLMACSGVPTVEIRSMQGESQNTHDTRITEARLSVPISADAQGNIYSLTGIGQKGDSESPVDDLNYDRFYLGGKVSGPAWWASLTTSAERYRLELATEYMIAPRLQATGSTVHKNKYGGGEKQTTQKAEICYKATKRLCLLGGYQVRNHGPGADSVEDEVIIGASYALH